MGVSAREANQRWSHNARGSIPRDYRPFDFASLLAAVEARVDSETYRGPNLVGEENRQAGVDRRQRRIYERLGMDPFTADRLAVQAGFHPAEVWPHWWDEAAADPYERQQELF